MKHKIIVVLIMSFILTSTIAFAEDVCILSSGNETYTDGYFTSVGEVYNLMNNRNIEMYFDTEISSYSAIDNIFATCDAEGNGERIKLIIKTNEKKLTIGPSVKWPEGDVYIFIKGSLCDSCGNLLGQNLKYKLNIRGDTSDK